MPPADRLPGLHALRFLAATAVFLLHVIYWSANWVPEVRYLVSLYFQMGVQLFYCVSAFALMYSTQLYADRTDWVRAFYLKRIFRIAPLFYVITAITIVHLATLGLKTSFLELLLNVTFVNNLVPVHALGIAFAGWSVSVEMLFYLIFPILFVHIRTLRDSLAFLAFAILLGEIARRLLDPISLETWTYGEFSLAANLRYFAFGMVAYFAYARLRATRWGAPQTDWRSASTFHFVCAALLTLLLATIFATESFLRPLHRIDMVLWGAVFGLLTVWFSVRPLPGMGWAPIQFLGERSYSLYLVHTLVIVYMRPVAAWIYERCVDAMGAWALVPAILATWAPVVLISSLTYLLIERPGMALGRRVDDALRRRDETRSVLTPAASAS